MANMWAILLPRIFPSADVSDLVYGFRERFVPMGQTLLNKAEFEERDYTTHAAVVKLVPDTIPRFEPFFPAPACPCSKPQSPAIPLSFPHAKNEAASLHLSVPWERGRISSWSSGDNPFPAGFFCRVSGAGTARSFRSSSHGASKLDLRPA